MQRAPIPPPPCVVGGMLRKQEGSWKGSKNHLLEHPSSLGEDAPTPTIEVRSATLKREISDPPVLNYQDQYKINTANGL